MKFLFYIQRDNRNVSIPLVVWPVSKSGNGPVRRRLGSLRLTVTAFESLPSAPRSGVDVQDVLFLLNPTQTIKIQIRHCGLNNKTEPVSSDEIMPVIFFLN